MAKVRLVVDMQAAVRPNRSGVGVYTARLVEHIAKDNLKKIEIIGHYYNFLGRQPINELPDAPNIHYKVSRLVPEKAVNLFRRFGLSIPFEILSRTRGDIHLFPNFLAQPSLFKTPAICVIHDFAYLDKPESLNRKNRHDLNRFVPNTLNKSLHIIANSQSTKSLAIKHYQIPEDKITVVTPAIDERLFSPCSKKDIVAARKKYKLPAKYILFTGTLEPRKNIEGILRAYEALADDVKKSTGLVLVGGKGWNDEPILQTISELRNTGENIVTTGYVPDVDLPAIYSGASLFVYPSFYEGFGIPILEAMACGVPVITADNTSLPEAAGDAGLYVKANDVSGLADAMGKVLSNPKLAKTLQLKGFNQTKRFSWQKSAQKLLAVIESLPKQPL